MNAYEQKQEARRARLTAAADRAAQRSDELWRAGDLREEVSGIPFGQPILVGHHSEGKHRRAIERAENKMRASVAEDKRAKELRAKAEGVGKGGISSDDPDALDKLRAKLAEEEAAQTFMREANKAVRRARKNPAIAERGADAAEFADYLAELRALRPDFPATAAAELLRPDFAGRAGFASYQLSNTGAEVRRIKARIAQLEKNAEAETVARSVPGFGEIIENAEANRLQIVFDGKPDADTRRELKSAGFRWAPSAGAWQRQLTNAARYAAERLARQFGDT